MELIDLLELLYTAHKRFTTIQAAWQYWYDNDLMNVAQQRWAALHSPGSVSMLASASSKGNDGPKVTRLHRHVWWQKPACWRDDYQLEGHESTTTILCNGDWWAFTSGIGLLYTNVMPKEQWVGGGVRKVRAGHASDLEQRIQEVPFLDPSFLLTIHDLKPIAETTYAGREAVQVRSTYQKGKDRIYDGFFWATADAYDLLIDKKNGILLRYAAQIGGQEYAVSSVEQVVFDEPIPDDIFSFPSN